MTQPRKIVLDASAVIDYLLRKDGWETLDKLIPYAVITVANLTEALAVIEHQGSQLRTSDQLAGALADLGARFDTGDPADAVRAAELIAASRSKPVGARKMTLSLGDALCIACAERLNLPLAGADQLWETLDLRVKYFPYR